MEDNFTPELIEKAKTARSAEELIALAKENSIELSDDEAKNYFDKLNASGALSDEELNNVAGRCGGGASDNDPHINMIIAGDNDTGGKGVL